ncbi:MAG: hypothetical protein RSA12_04765 [Clostridia bacterium]
MQSITFSASRMACPGSIFLAMGGDNLAETILFVPPRAYADPSKLAFIKLGTATDPLAKKALAWDAASAAYRWSVERAELRVAVGVSDLRGQFMLEWQTSTGDVATWESRLFPVTIDRSIDIDALIVAEQPGYLAAFETRMDASVAQAQAHAQSIAQMTVQTKTLSPDVPATATSEVLSGVVKLTLGIPKGAIGPQGAKGDTGARGSQGVQGVKGDVGATGATGATGLMGDVGLPGPEGPPGLDGLPGLNGLKGDTGNGIASFARTAGTGAAGTTDTYTLTMTDGSTKTVPIYNGRDGQGVEAENTRKASETALDILSQYVMMKLARSNYTLDGLDAAKLDLHATADKADTLATAKTIAIGGKATGAGVSFDGSGNITIQITALDPTGLSAAVAASKGGTGATDAAGARTNLGAVAQTDYDTYVSDHAKAMLAIVVAVDAQNSVNQAANRLHEGRIATLEAKVAALTTLPH